MEEVIVKGTRSHTEHWASNHASVSQDDLEESGLTSWHEYLARLPQAGGGSLAEGRFESLAPGTASVALRGLRADSTLVLVDGRRVPVYPFAEGGSTNFVDLSSLPQAVVENLEILPPTAGGLYGSDAVAGVINYGLNDHFDGIDANLRYVDTHQGGGDVLKAGWLGGFQGENSGIVLAADYSSGDTLAQHERSYAVSDDKRPLGGSDWRSSVSNPGNIIDPRTGERLRVPRDSDGAPTIGELEPGTNRFDRAPYQVLSPDSKRYGVTMLAHANVGAGWEAFAHTFWRRSELGFELSPAPIQGDDQGISVPAQNPYNPFDEEVFFRYRLTEAGPRQQEISSDSLRLLSGVHKEIGDNWSLEIAALFHEIRTTQKQANDIFRPALEAALARTDPGKALNVFGAGHNVNSTPLIDELLLETNRDGISQLHSVDAVIKGNISLWPAGDISVTAGVDHRWESLQDDADPRVQKGEVVDFKTTSAQGDRRTLSVYSDLRIPLIAAPEDHPRPTLEGLLSARFEESSGFGSSLIPNLALIWRAMPLGAFRVSYGQSFRTPGLAQLHSSQTFQARELRDSKRFDVSGDPLDRAASLLVKTGGNGSLDAERSDHIGIGLLFNPTSSLSMDMEAFRIEQQDGISELDPQHILDNEHRFPGLVQRRPAGPEDELLGIPGRVISINSIIQNVAEVTIEGIDIDIDWTVGGNWGLLNSHLSAVWLGKYEETSQPGLAPLDRSGGFGRPRWRAITGSQWSKGNWSAGAAVSYVDETRDREETRRIDSYTKVDLNLAREFGPHLTIRLNVNNIFNEDPPFADNRQGYVPSLADSLGRTFVVSVSWRR